MKKWSILLYANGNNELEPEIWKSFLKLRSVPFCEDIQIVAQVSRQSQKITEIICPKEKYPDFNEVWIGAIRFSIDKMGCMVKKLMGEINMASPNTLKEFLIWSGKNYPSENYMLIIGGHVYQFVGICPDYTGEKPYLMSFAGLTQAIQEGCSIGRFKLDILLMDACYISAFETLCEFGKYTSPAVKSILTYIGAGPTTGFPYDLLIKIIDEEIENKNYKFDYLIETIIQKIPKYNFMFPLIAIKIDHKLLEACKNQFSKIAELYLRDKNKYKMITTPYELLKTVGDLYPWSDNIKLIHQISYRLIIKQSDRDINKNKGLPIHVLFTTIKDKERKELYNNLYFSLNNFWTVLVCDSNQLKTTYEPPSTLPMEMTDNILQAFISNANKDLIYEEKVKIKENLIKNCYSKN